MNPIPSTCMPMDPRRPSEKTDFISDILGNNTDVRVRVTGRSMSPFIKSGSIVTLRKTPVKELRVGDLVLCRSRGHAMTLHRLIGFMKKKSPGSDRAFLITKGDALDAPDPPTDPADCLGRVIRVESGGRSPETSLDMDAIWMRASNYVRGWYHRAKSTMIGHYVQLKKHRVAGHGDPVLGLRNPCFPFSAADPPGLAWIQNQHLQGIVYREVKDQYGPATPECRPLRQAYYSVLASNIRRLGEMENLESYLAHEKISVMLFKGAALLEDVYPDLGMRPMEDIDILVRPKDRHGVEKILGRLGFAQDATFPHMFSKNGVCIDLHGHPVHADRIGGRDAVMAMDLNRIWEDSSPWRPGLDHIRKPGDADHLILLAHHMIKHSFSKWIWLHDVYCLVKRFDEAGWGSLAQKTAIYRQQRPVAVMLYMVERVFGLKPPERTSLAKWMKKLSLLEKAILNIKARGGEAADLGNVLWLYCIQGYRQRLAFLQATVFAARSKSNAPAHGVHAEPKGSGTRIRLQRLNRVGRNLKILMKGVMLNRSF